MCQPLCKLFWQFFLLYLGGSGGAKPPRPFKLKSLLQVTDSFILCVVYLVITFWHICCLVKFIVLSCYQFCYWLLGQIYFVLFVTHTFYVLYMSWSFPDIYVTESNLFCFVCDSPKRFSPFFLHAWRIRSIHQMAQMICLHLKVQTDIIHPKFSHETVQYTPNSWTMHLLAKMKLLWHLLMILAICVQS